MGLEPTTLRLEVLRAIQLRHKSKGFYHFFCFFGLFENKHPMWDSNPRPPA